ncbi:MAG: PBP1A family penicillin-binding protein, partial [candidate division Zixibacteria bacterium]|nr:PBP1A family penicillin-binding protein [candidate division Zixibacteria bacterium]
RKVVLLITVLIVAACVVKLVHVYTQELPSLEQLHNIEPSLITKIYSSEGSVLKEYYHQRRIVVPLAKMPPHLIEALIATEDQRFYKHWGVDVFGIFRAMIKNILKGDLTAQGGSTLTQQLARTLFLTPEKVLSRKIKEILAAIKIERTYSKNEIIEMYLNQCYFGKGAYGIQAAAQLYFNKDVEELSISDCAVLVGILVAPSRFSPLNSPELATQRRNIVLTRMASENILTQATADSLRARPLEISPFPGEIGEAPYFTELVRQHIEKRYGETALYQGGLTIYTTLRLDLQKAAERELIAKLDTLQRDIEIKFPLSDPDYTLSHVDSSKNGKGQTRVYKKLQGALLAMDNSTGKILSLVGGRDFDETKFNRATQALRQPGSSFKPFVYVAAIEKGLHPSDIMYDTPVVLENLPGEEWRPRNYDRIYRGPVTLREGLADSRNLVAIKLLQKVGPELAVDYAKLMGISSPLNPVPSIAIGTSEVTLWEMVRAFSAFPNQGVLIEPLFIEKIVDRYGNILEDNKTTKRELVLDRETAYIVTSMMQSVIDGGTGSSVRRYGFIRPAAGKTGTTDQTTDNWFLGFVPQITCGVWIGFDDKTSIGSHMTGGSTAAPVWAEVMKSACEHLPVEDFVIPDHVFRRTVCWDSGKLATRNCPKPITDLFTADTEPKERCPLHPGPVDSVPY